MAMIKCVECGKEISSKANVCPNCGVPHPQVTDEQVKEQMRKSEDEIIIKKLKWLILWIIVATFFIIAGGLAEKLFFGFIVLILLIKFLLTYQKLYKNNKE